MTKKAYEQPTLTVFETGMEQQILAGSVTKVSTTGLEGVLILPGTTGSMEEAW